MTKPTLILVRHGETVGESSIRYHGRTDVALSELGRAQMLAARDAIVARIGGEKFHYVFSSPLIRATEGARVIGGATAPLTIIEDFAEVHFGLFEGLTADEIRDRYPDHYAEWNVDRLAASYAYPGGESRTAFAERVGRGLDRMLEIWQPARDAASRALLVAHRGVIRTIVERLTGHRPAVDLGSIQVLEFDDRWNAVQLDFLDHLKE
jgi:broad specificity phosphatase PhoE